MPRFGAIGSATDAPNKAQRSGTISLLITDVLKTVTFGTAMPSANYRVFLQEEGNLAASFWPTNKLAASFDLNISVGIVGSVAYLVVED